jgi:hypothetical protein
MDRTGKDWLRMEGTGKEWNGTDRTGMDRRGEAWKIKKKRIEKFFCLYCGF